MSTRETILAAVGRMVTLPVAAGRLIPLLQSPECDIEAVGDAISFDPQLTANILRMANSSLLGGYSDVKTIEQAVIRLGTARLLTTVLATVVGPVASRPVEGYELRKGALWERSVLTALTTKEYAEVTGMTPPAEAFTAGLLCDIGKVALGPFLEQEQDAIGTCAFSSGHSYERAEREVLGVDHMEVGAALLASWNLPRSIIEVVRWHHDPELCPMPFQPIADLVHVADHSCALIGVGSGGDGTHYSFSAQAIERLGIGASDVEAGMCSAMNRLEEVREVFGLAA